MRILLANDDGITSDGIRALAKSLSEIAEVYVFAPNIQKSASGHGMTIRSKFGIKKVDFENAVFAYEIAGTPVDCVKIGIQLMREKGLEPDIVVSGINHGENLGTDTVYSGTVAAAMEGFIKGYPAVAVSVEGHRPYHFEYAAKLANEAVLKLAERPGMRTVININTPNIPAEDVKGVKIAALGPREYIDRYEYLETDSDGFDIYETRGGRVIHDDIPKDLDVMVIYDNYATITPLRDDYTDYSLLDEVRTWGFEKDEQ